MIKNEIKTEREKKV